MSEEQKVSCPKCGSSLIQPITNALRCGACGHQFGQVRDVVVEAARVRRQAGFVGNWRPQK